MGTSAKKGGVVGLVGSLADGDVVSDNLAVGGDWRRSGARADDKLFDEVVAVDWGHFGGD